MEKPEDNQNAVDGSFESSGLLEVQRAESEAWARVETEIPKLAEHRRLIAEQIDAILDEWAVAYGKLKAAKRSNSSNG